MFESRVQRAKRVSLLFGAASVAALMLAVSCSGAQNAVNLGAPSASATGATGASRALLVLWRQGPEDDPYIESTLVADNGEVVGERKEAVVVADGKLFAIRDKKIPSAGCDCASCPEKGCTPNQTLAAFADSPALYELGGDDAKASLLVDLKVPTKCDHQNNEHHDTEWTALSVLGDQLCFNVRDSFSTCGGMHAFFDTSAWAIDLTTRKTYPTDPPADLQATLVAQANTKLNDMGSPDTAVPPTFFRGWSWINGDGKIASKYVYSKSAPYGSMGPSSYQMQTDIDVDGPLPSMPGKVSIPDWARATIARIHAVGMTSVIPAASADAAKELFLKAPTPPRFEVPQ